MSAAGERYMNATDGTAAGLSRAPGRRSPAA